LFIDGAYLRQRHADMISRVFGKPGKLDLTTLRRSVIRQTPEGSPGQFQRVFYYDCLHDVAKVDETPEELSTRIREQKAFFDTVQTHHGFHVRLGSLSGSSRKLRQKEVDILLTVEMLDHAFRKNMTSAALLAGDLDFAPLLESLVRLGTWVDLYHDPRSIAQGLLASADRGIPLTFHNYYSLLPNDFQQANPLPQVLDSPNWVPESIDYSKVRVGRTVGGGAVSLYQKRGQAGEFVLRSEAPSGPRVLIHSNAAVVENFFAVNYSTVEWQNDPTVETAF